LIVLFPPFNARPVWLFPLLAYRRVPEIILRHNRIRREANPAALPRAVIAWAIFREVWSVILSPSMTAPHTCPW
jgi:hypothetical protein